MADFAIANKTLNAQNYLQTGLLNKIYFFLQNENASIAIDPATGQVEGVTMKSTKKAYSFIAEIDEGVASFPLAGGTGVYGTQTLTFSVDQLTPENRLALMQYDRNTGLCAIVQLANGQRLLFGIDADGTTTSYRFCGKINAGENSSGTISETSTTVVNRMFRTYTWNSINPPVFVETTLDLEALLTAAS